MAKGKKPGAKGGPGGGHGKAQPGGQHAQHAAARGGGAGGSSSHGATVAISAESEARIRRALEGVPLEQPSRDHPGAATAASSLGRAAQAAPAPPSAAKLGKTYDALVVGRCKL